MDASYLAQIITFLTLIGGIIYQIYRENRQRRWDTEDKREIALKLAETNKTIDIIHSLTNSSMTKQMEITARISEAKAVITKDPKDILQAEESMKVYLNQVKTQERLNLELKAVPVPVPSDAATSVKKLL